MTTQQEKRSLPHIRGHHLDELRASGLSDETIAASGIYTESQHSAIAAILNRRGLKKSTGEAIVFPFRDVSTGQLNGYKRCKFDQPRKRDGKPIKYESPVGERNHIYVPVGTMPYLKETGSRLVITEGEKKALKLDQEGFPAIGLVGVYGWKDKGVERLLPELEFVRWSGREVLIVFDSDITEKEEVRDAASRLSAQLINLGATVKLVTLPDEPNGDKNGADDFLVRHGRDEFYELITHAEEPEPVDAGSVKIDAKHIDPLREARNILLREKHSDGHDTIRHFRGEFWRWQSGRYIEISDDEVRAAIQQHLDQHTYKIKARAVSDVLAALRAEAQLPEQHDAPFWLDGMKGPKNIIAFRNGIVDRDALLKSNEVEVQPHTAAWFSPIRLPYNFDPAAQCPRWQAVIDHALSGDPEQIRIVQEFFGYCILPTAEFQKFLVLEGEGNNGKSVILAALRGMLGADNVSAVPLEMFGGRFSLATTLGKLANVVAECGEIDKAAEGYLKAFTSGDLMFFDRKNKSPITAVPSARFILSTNNRPRFSDKSGGLWRRMLLITLTAVVEESRRVIGMDKTSWWEESGELPGVFLWALDGLRRLLKNGKFTDSAAVKTAINDYQRQLNPAKRFLLEHYTADAGLKITNAEIYPRYIDWCKENGVNRPLQNSSFGLEIRRAFRDAKVGKVRNAHGKRVNGWHGIGHAPSEEFNCDDP